MYLYYSKKEKLWFHSIPNESLLIGGRNVPISFYHFDEHCIEFPAHINEKKAGPFIGIMISKTKKGKWIGNITIIQYLVKELLKKGGIPFLFSPEQLTENSISEGLLFHPNTKEWLKVYLPIPDAVYNRIPNREYENTKECLNTIHFFQKHHIPFFNPHFLDKYECYKLLVENEKLKKYLPPTIMIDDQEKLKQFLQLNKEIYVKLANSSRGKGVHYLKIRDDQSILFKSPKKIKYYPTFHHYWNSFNGKFIKKRYIAQKAISPKKIQGKRYDFRVLAHNKENGFKITGIGVRRSNVQNITTHIPLGGKLLPFEYFKTTEILNEIEQILNEISVQFSNHQKFFGEISLDIGESESNQLFLYEINSKPMTFDEPMIEQKRMEKLAEILFHLSGFH